MILRRHSSHLLEPLLKGCVVSAVVVMSGPIKSGKTALANAFDRDDIITIDSTGHSRDFRRWIAEVARKSQIPSVSVHVFAGIAECSRRAISAPGRWMFPGKVHPGKVRRALRDRPPPLDGWWSLSLVVDGSATLEMSAEIVRAHLLSLIGPTPLAKRQIARAKTMRFAVPIAIGVFGAITSALGLPTLLAGLVFIIAMDILGIPRALSIGAHSRRALCYPKDRDSKTDPESPGS